MASPTSPQPTSCEECTNPSSIPDTCEVDILIDIMETGVLGSHELLSQWTRAAFHDAGTFNQGTGEGGANGCLLNYPPMRYVVSSFSKKNVYCPFSYHDLHTLTCSLEPENNFFDLPLNTLLEIKNTWNAHPSTCIDISSADILQFAIFFATTRQKDFPESLISGASTANAKRETLKTEFLWGRPDEMQCDTMWVENLPGLNSVRGGPIPRRCTLAGGEIKNKMIDRNGFTAGMIMLLDCLINTYVRSSLIHLPLLSAM